MKGLKNILNTFNLYSSLLDGFSKVLIFITPTKNNWSSLAQPTDDCPVYAYRERDDGGYNQVPLDELSVMNQKEISEKLDDEFGDVK